MRESSFRLPFGMFHSFFIPQVQCFFLFLKMSTMSMRCCRPLVSSLSLRCVRFSFSQMFFFGRESLSIEEASGLVVARMWVRESDELTIHLLLSCRCRCRCRRRRRRRNEMKWMDRERKWTRLVVVFLFFFSLILSEYFEREKNSSEMHRRAHLLPLW